MMCSNCGSSFDTDGACPSCGHVNMEPDPKAPPRDEPAAAVRRKPEIYIIVFAILGIIANSVMAIEGFVSLIRRASNPNSILELSILAIQIVVSVGMVAAFINILRLRKWALWAVRILYLLSILFLAFFGKLSGLQLVMGILLIGIFTVGDWKEYS